MTSKIRIDKLLVERALVPSRERARALLLAGKVLVDDVPVTKPGTTVADDAEVRLRGDDNPFVSRGGLKLQGALDALSIVVRDKQILDVGASTGGFTDCCLQRGARGVYAVDVGTNQLAYSLRQDPRVLCLEQTNARHLEPSQLPGRADLAVIDVSFISLTRVLEPVIACLRAPAEILALVKPQFEAGREQVGKGGVVRDPAVRAATIDRVEQFARGIGLAPSGRADSPLKGPKGNQETFVYLRGTADEATEPQ